MNNVYDVYMTYADKKNNEPYKHKYPEFEFKEGHYKILDNVQEEHPNDVVVYIGKSAVIFQDELEVIVGDDFDLVIGNTCYDIQHNNSYTFKLEEDTDGYFNKLLVFKDNNKIGAILVRR